MKRAVSVPLQPTITLPEDQMFYLGAMALYAGRPHSHVHEQKLEEMQRAVNDATLMWAVMRAHLRRAAPGDDVPDAPSPSWTP